MDNQGRAFSARSCLLKNPREYREMKRRKRRKRKTKKLLLTVIAALVVSGIIIAVFVCKKDAADNKEKDSGIKVVTDEEAGLDAGYSIEVTEIGSYSGPYMEDASDQDVADVMMIRVRNTGEEPIQYAEVTIFSEGEEAGLFKFSSLMPEETMLVLEADKQIYDKEEGYSQAVASNVALFQNEPSMYADMFEIQSLDGGFNITNISSQDIEGEIVIYFKDCERDVLMGGITYRGRIEGGLKMGEVRQVMSSNFTENNTRIMFITIDGK